MTIFASFVDRAAPKRVIHEFGRCAEDKGVQDTWTVHGIGAESNL